MIVNWQLVLDIYVVILLHQHKVHVLTQGPSWRSLVARASLNV